jgi:hypothetical protein
LRRLGLAAASLLTRFATAAHGQQPRPLTNRVPQRRGISPNRAVLERYYSALQEKYADKLRRAIEEGFAPNAVLRTSDSLPYEGPPFDGPSRK